MKKILLLGGSAQQIIAIKTAKKLGYYTILCDYLPDNPGQFEADKFYLVSTTDKDRVLEVATTEKVDGIIAYASDPAAPTAAYVAEKLNLPSNPYESVEILCNKDKFRNFLKENNLSSPCAHGYSDKNVNISLFNLPVIVKPVDSSGSKGSTVLHSWVSLDNALDFAFSYSRSHKLIVEEFIEKKHKYLIGGDIFVNNGKIELWGLLNCHRDNNVNPLVPVGKSYPLLISKDDELKVKGTLQKIIDRLHIQFGSINVELVIDKKGNVYPIDIGPRAGGNMIPDLLNYIFDVNLIEMAIKASMGEKVDVNIKSKTCFYATHNLHCSNNGIYKNIIFSKTLENHIIKACLYKKTGDKIEYFDNAAKALGIIFMKFDNQEEMNYILENINSLYLVELEENA